MRSLKTSLVLSSLCAAHRIQRESVEDLDFAEDVDEFLDEDEVGEELTADMAEPRQAKSSLPAGAGPDVDWSFMTGTDRLSWEGRTQNSWDVVSEHACNHGRPDASYSASSLCYWHPQLANSNPDQTGWGIKWTGGYGPDSFSCGRGLNGVCARCEVCHDNSRDKNAKVDSNDKHVVEIPLPAGCLKETAIRDACTSEFDNANKEMMNEEARCQEVQGRYSQAVTFHDQTVSTIHTSENAITKLTTDIGNVQLQVHQHENALRDHRRNKQTAERGAGRICRRYGVRDHHHGAEILKHRPTCPTPAPATPAPAPVCPHLNNQDIKAGTFQHIEPSGFKTDSNELCSAACTRRSRCTAWVRQPTTGNCWLTSQSSPTFEADVDRVAGVKCPAPAGLIEESEEEVRILMDESEEDEDLMDDEDENGEESEDVEDYEEESEGKTRCERCNDVMDNLRDAIRGIRDSREKKERKEARVAKLTEDMVHHRHTLAQAYQTLPGAQHTKLALEAEWLPQQEHCHQLSAAASNARHNHMGSCPQKYYDQSCEKACIEIQQTGEHGCGVLEGSEYGDAFERGGISAVCQPPARSWIMDPHGSRINSEEQCSRINSAQTVRHTTPPVMSGWLQIDSGRRWRRWKKRFMVLESGNGVRSATLRVFDGALPQGSEKSNDGIIMWDAESVTAADDACFEVKHRFKGRDKKWKRRGTTIKLCLRRDDYASGTNLRELRDQWVSALQPLLIWRPRLA